MKATSTATRRRGGGFSLIELMMVVAMIGILASIGGVAWMRYVKKSRTSEAVGHLEKMWVGAMAYYETDHALSSGTMAPKQFPFDPLGTTLENSGNLCCPNKCNGNDPAYNVEPWPSLTFNIADKHLYVPAYSADATHLYLQVWGDLDCDTTKSQFIRNATVLANGDIQGYLTPAVINELE